MPWPAMPSLRAVTSASARGSQELAHQQRCRVNQLQRHYHNNNQPQQSATDKDNDTTKAVPSRTLSTRRAGHVRIPKFKTDREPRCAISREISSCATPRKKAAGRPQFVRILYACAPIPASIGWTSPSSASGMCLCCAEIRGFSGLLLDSVAWHPPR
jgi:hypothetical protein